MTLDEVVIDILRDRAWDADSGATDQMRAAQDRMADWIADNPDDFWARFGERFLDELETVALLKGLGE